MEDGTSKTDGETRLNAWYGQAKEAANKDDFAQAQAICQRAAEACEQADRDRDASAAHHNAGMYAYQRGEFDEAEAAYRRSLAIDERTGDEQGSARTLNNLSAIANSRGDHAEAVDLLVDSIRIKEGLGDESGVATSYHWLGIVAASRGDLDAEEDWYQQSLAAKAALGDDHGQAVTCLALYLGAVEKKDHDGSQDWLDQAMQALDRCGDVYVTINLGRDAERRESLDEALAIYRKAVEIARTQDDESKIAISCRYFGAIAAKRGDYQTAKSYAEESLAIEERLGREERVAYDRRWIDQLEVFTTIIQGHDAERRESPDEALALYRKATEIAETQDDEERLSRCLNYLGALAGKTGDYETARACYERALAINERVGNEEGIAICRQWLKWIDDASSSGDGF